MEPTSRPGPDALVEPPPPREEPRGLYRRIAAHEQSLWIATIAVVVMSAGTLALLTVTAGMHGIFDGPGNGYLLAGGVFLLLAMFIFYMAWQRRALEKSRVCIFRELERHSAELAEANRALNDALQTRDVFLNTVSHELKTPLTCVIAYSESLAEEEIDREAAREHARTVLREAKSLQRLLEQLFEVTRIRSGRLRLDRTDVDLGLVVKRVAERERPDADVLGLGFTLSLTGEALPARADPRRLEDAVGTLLHNAIRHSPPSGRVELRTRRLDDWAEIEIRDETERSVWAEREALDHPFAGLDPRPCGRAGDLGLGLPLVKQFVMAHGGAVHVSEGRRGGIVYRIQLPLLSLAGRDRTPEPPSIDAFPLDLAS